MTISKLFNRYDICNLCGHETLVGTLFLTPSKTTPCSMCENKISSARTYPQKLREAIKKIWEISK